MFGRARPWVKDSGIKSFRVLDNLSGNRLYFFGVAINDSSRSGQKQVSWMPARDPSSFIPVANPGEETMNPKRGKSVFASLAAAFAAINADPRKTSRIEKVLRNRPADLREGCNTRDPVPTFIAQRQVREQHVNTACGQAYPTNSFPREVAGADIAADIIKCQRKPLRQRDYAAAFSPAQWARLQAVFPTGVCDWSRRGEEQQDAETWVVID